MLCIVSDTHGTDGHRLDGRTAEAVREAEAVIHAGDFTTEAALDAFESASRELYAVHGNNATPVVRERLPAERVVEHDGVRLALTHGDDRDETALSLFGRQAQAKLVVFGHSHRPEFVDAGDISLLNPGSHADPRWYRPAHAELDIHAKHIDGRLLEPTGDIFEEFRVHVNACCPKRL